MAVRIRMARAGSKRKPFYRFVVIDSKTQRDGGFLDWVGHYNPIAKPHKITVDEAKVSHWLGRGAILSEGVRSLLKKNGTLARIGGSAQAGKAGAGEGQTEAPAEGQAVEGQAAGESQA
jgi:small subunit ribosomal protein S16